MALSLPLVFVILLFIFLLLVTERIFVGPLAKVPGPKLYALTSWRLALDDWQGQRTRRLCRLHRRYGPAVRVGPSEVSFNSLSALRSIYGAGSGFERTQFYRMFDAYGRQTMFTFGPSHQHAERKKLLAHVFSKSMVIKGRTSTMIQEKVRKFIDLVAEEQTIESEIFSSLHYFSLDSSTDFLYGEHGRTAALDRSSPDRSLIDDILDPARRKLSWFVVHFPLLTKWLYSQTGSMGRVLKPLLPMQKPSTYTGIREYALRAWKAFEHNEKNIAEKSEPQSSLVACLWKHHDDQAGNLDDLDIAAECADNLLAGIDTTSDTLTFLIWALSLPENSKHQERLISEVSSLPLSAYDASGIPSPEACSHLPYLDAVIKETLRLYAPLPASEPRSLPVGKTVDGYLLPRRTVVSMSPYALHRNPEVFENPTVFDPDRWLGESDKVTEMKKWWWAFSSGARMCTGMHLAMAQMTTLAATVYKRYRTTIAPGFEGISPAITSRFELFYDDRYDKIEEHTCLVRFRPQP